MQIWLNFAFTLLGVNLKSGNPLLGEKVIELLDNAIVFKKRYSALQFKMFCNEEKWAFPFQ